MRKRQPRKDTKVEYVIRHPAQLSALGSPARFRVVEYLSTNGASSIAEIAQSMSIQPHGLYHHIKVLKNARLVHQVGERQAGRRKEALFALVAERLRADLKSRNPGFQAALADIGVSALRVAARNFGAAVRDGKATLEGSQRNALARYLVLQLSPGMLEALNKDIDRLIQKYSAKKSNDEDFIEVGFAMTLAPKKPRQK